MHVQDIKADAKSYLTNTVVPVLVEGLTELAVGWRAHL